MELQGIYPLGEFYKDAISRTFPAIVFNQFGSQASGLYPYHGVEFGIKVRLSPKADLGSPAFWSTPFDITADNS